MRSTRPELAHVEHVAKHLRAADRLEALCAYGVPGPEALMASWRDSTICRCLMDDTEPVGLCGLNETKVWFIGTDKIYSTKRHRYQFARMSKTWVDSLIEAGAKRLENWLFVAPEVDNKEKLRWLVYLGFTIAPPNDWRSPAGYSFRHYWREA